MTKAQYEGVSASWLSRAGHAIVGMIMAGMFRLLADPDNTSVLTSYGEACVRLITEGMAKS